MDSRWRGKDGLIPEDCRVAAPLAMTGSFDRIRTNGGFALTPAPPIEGEGLSFDRIRTNGGFALTPALSHRGRGGGDVLRQAQDERGRWAQRDCHASLAMTGSFDELRMNGGGCQYLRRKGAGTPRICFRTTDQTSAIAARTDAVSRPMIFTPTPLPSGSVVTPARTWG